MHIIIPCSGWMGSAVNDITEKRMYCVEYPDAQEIPGLKGGGGLLLLFYIIKGYLLF